MHAVEECGAPASVRPLYLKDFRHSDDARKENLATAGCPAGVSFHEERAASPGPKQSSDHGSWQTSNGRSPAQPVGELVQGQRVFTAEPI